MKAIRLHGRGGSRHLVYEDVPQPRAGPGVIDTVFPLAQARQAYEQAARGHTRGKIVLRVVDDGPDQQSNQGIAGDK